jgi:4-amino-4-deoxy-L-arabinose transferase-like glycosyltransferase
MDAAEHELTPAPTEPAEPAEPAEPIGPPGRAGTTGPEARRPSWYRPSWQRAAFWRSPDDQPGWARPALLVIAAVSAFSYSWRAFAGWNVEVYYAAAVRSMSMSWSNFFFGAFDPAGTVTTDKLPGAFWVQAVSVWLFGAHRWAVVLPQVLEGTLTVLVLYRVVRRLAAPAAAGPAAGLLAAGILAISPATITLNRGNISDTLMILLAVLAADAIASAVTSGRRRYLLLAGVWVGLAFQAKMLEAWLVIPALLLAYLIAAPGPIRQRVTRAAAMAALTAVVSLSWMTVVTIWPASGRPYVDGSYDNSVFQQVFVYNGFGRLDQPTPDQLLDSSIKIGLPAPAPAGWDKLLTGALGRDTGWLLAAALIALLAGLAARHREPRTDPIRTSLVLWGTWLIVLGVVFSISPVHPYYLAALSPAVAALVGTGLALAWRSRREPLALAAVVLALAATAGYAAWLLPAAGTGLPGWLRPALIVIAVAAAGCLVALNLDRFRDSASAGLAALGLAAVAALIVPAAASASVVSSRLGPFDTPFEPAAVAAHVRVFFGAGFGAGRTVAALEQANAGAADLAATQTSVLAAPLIWTSGKEILPIGGFTGTIPEPTLGQLRSMVQHGDVRTFIQSATTTDPRLVWVAAHCFRVPPRPGNVPTLAVYFCLAAGNKPLGINGPPVPSNSVTVGPSPSG